MGLDLFCGNKYVCFGSYSIVHLIRLYWMKAFIEWMKEQNELYEDDYNVEYFVDIIRNNEIDYDKLSDIELDFKTFIGIKTFVSHSDCEGTWDSMESSDILFTLYCIKKYLKQIDKTHFEGDIYYLEDILKYSSKNDMYIRFH